MDLLLFSREYKFFNWGCFLGVFSGSVLGSFVVFSVPLVLVCFLLCLLLFLGLMAARMVVLCLTRLGLCLLRLVCRFVLVFGMFCNALTTV